MGKHIDMAIKLLAIKHKESSVQNHVFAAQMRPSKSSQGHTNMKKAALLSSLGNKLNKSE